MKTGIPDDPSAFQSGAMRAGAVLAFVLCFFLFAAPARAQFTANNQTNVLNGAALDWVPVAESYIVGDTESYDALIIENGGVLSNSFGVIGNQAGANGNAVIVSGTGSVWSNLDDLTVGNSGAGNQLVVTNGGAVFATDTYQGDSGNNNAILVSGTGSVWNTTLGFYVGLNGSGNSLAISNGGAVYDGYGHLGDQPSSAGNAALVIGSGSVWSNGSLLVGRFGSGNVLTITNGGTVISAFVALGFWPSGCSNLVTVAGNGAAWYVNALNVGFPGSSNQVVVGPGGAVIANAAQIGDSDPSVGIATNNVIRVNGGTLIVTNGGGGTLVVSPGGGSDSLILNGGTVTVDGLVATNGVNSIVTFNAGVLNSASTFVTNGQLFVVGDGFDSSTFNLLGGVHSFANNLEIRSNAFLTGCGTINGNVVVDQGGTVLANCGTLTFTGILTNNGSLWTTAGSVLEAYGPVINNGVIYLLDGGSTNFHSGFVNSGLVITTNDIPVITAIQVAGSNVQISVRTSNGVRYLLEETTNLVTWTLAPGFFGNGGIKTLIDTNAASLPQRFYRVGLAVPQ